jgi:hypothetical protein
VFGGRTGEVGYVAIDGTKIKANSSKHKAKSCKRMNETEAGLKREIDTLLAAAEKTDAEEEAQHGKERHGDELPVELQRRESRLQKIREAKAAFEQEAKEEAAQQRAETERKLAEREEDERCTGKKKRGRKPQTADPEQAKPDDTAQRNFVDPESRIMPDGANKGSFVQGYNAQITVDSASQVIVAAEVTQETNDKMQLIPMISQMVMSLEQKPERVSADTGYFSEANVSDESVKGVDLYVATGRDEHSGVKETISDPPPPDASPKEAMHHNLRTADGRAMYKMGNCGAGLRTDQGTAQFSPLQLAWQTECSPRVETGVRGQQPAEAVPGWLGSGNGIKRPEEESVLPETDPESLLHATNRISACALRFEGQPSKPRHRPWQNALPDRLLAQGIVILRNGDGALVADGSVWVG